MRLASCAAGLSFDINDAKRLETVVKSGPILGLLIVNDIMIHFIKSLRLSASCLTTYTLALLGTITL